MSERNRDKNVTSVIDQLRDREQAGLNKYGTNTERTDLDTLEWLQHLQEELMDGAVYIERLKGDVKELLRLSTEPEGREEQPEWHPGHEPQVAGHGDIHEEDKGGITFAERHTAKRTSVMNNHNTFYGTDEDKEEEYEDLPRFATDREAGFVDDTTGLNLHTEDSTPQHIKIPTDD